MHWDGSAWNIVPVPKSIQGNALAAVAGRNTDDVWAVGDYGRFPGIHTLALHWDGKQWAQAYSPNISPDLATLNGVALGSDGDVWAAGSYSLNGKTLVERFRPGVCCQFAFTDVQAADYFYEAVRHLYCNGAISGYIDNTFRPYNNTTRGQLTKIVVLGFGMPTYTLPTATFNDVPTTHTFYQ